jgi:PAS domain S-box-containing protein
LHLLTGKTLKELLLKTLSTANETGERSLVLFIDTQIIVIKGHWNWELASDVVFCSDVILSDYKWFEGTKAIIHPEDMDHLKQHLRFIRQTGISTFRFRIITTYGEIKTLRGEDVKMHEPGPSAAADFTAELVEKEAEARLAAKETEIMLLAKKGFDLSEQLNNTGTWYINTATSEGFYSDTVYTIYGLPPQSLNAHLNTFCSYIHFDDAAIVAENTDKAYKARLPLHIEFRIIRHDGEERTIRRVTQWRFNDKGEAILYGIIKDITEEKNTENELYRRTAHLQLSKQLEKFQDQVSNTAHWFVELLTRNAVYSDNYYKIFGLKPQSIQGKLVRFSDYIHQDDRDAYQEALRGMHYEHKPPNIEFRIVRADGKVRKIRQSARIEIYGDSEMVMIGIIEDITQRLTLERKATELDEKWAVQHVAFERSEEISGTGTMIVNLHTDEVTWSANLFRLLGYKPHIIQPGTSQIERYVHQHHRKRFRDEMQLAIENNGGTEFDMQLYRMGEVRYFKTSFKLSLFGEKRFLIGTFRDITAELEQAQLTLEKVQLVDLLTENILDRVLITDIDNNITFWNRQCENHYKLQASEVLRKNFFEVLPALKEQQVLNNFREAFKGRPVHGQHVHDLVTNKYIDIHLLPLKNEFDEVTGILHILHDVTEQYELKQKLTERLGFIERILETTVDRIKVFDRNMNFIYWNTRCESYYGIKKSDAIGKNILEIFPGLQNNAAYYQFRVALKGETVYISPEQAIHDGMYHQTYLIPVKNENGETTSVLWVTHDFSKEYHLLEEQKKAHSILDTIEEACYELDEKSNFIFVNRKAEILWGRSREELLGNNIWGLFPQGIDSALYFAINHSIETKELVQQEILSPMLNRNVFINITPTPEGGAIVAFTDLYDTYRRKG